MAPDRRGQLDALLDVELLLAGDDAGAHVTVAEGKAPRPPLAPDLQLGKYRLERLLGAGGMGMVWQARDVELDRAVALKVLSPTLDGDGVARSRLVREARAMARLHHPNVITVFDALTIDGRDVIAMALIDGETMASWLDRARPRDQIVGAILAAGRGLAAAHAAGMIHRDFKPHNVLVDRAGHVVVTDFGLARAVGDGVATAALDAPALPDLALTVTGAVLGTPAYMAPEQLAGIPADARADQFAFCTTAWEALAGQRPFAGATAAEAIAARAAEPLRGADRVPRRLRPILERGLAREPAARWPSIDALLDAMSRAWRRPRRIALALVAVAMLAGIAAGALVLRRVPWQPQIVALPAFEENGDGPALSPDGTQIAYVSDRDHTGTFRAYVATLPAGEPRAITPAGETYQTPRWTRDGSALLLVGWDEPSHAYHIVRQPIAGGPFTDLGTGLQADDCGDVIAIADTQRTSSELVLRHADGTRHVLIHAATEWISLPRCDRTGQRIVFTRGPTSLQDPIDDVFVVDRAGHETALTHDHASTGGAFTPDGRAVVFTAMRGDKIELFEVSTAGGEPHQLTFDEGPHFSPDVSSDGRTVAFNIDSSTIVVMAGSAGQVHKLTSKRELLSGAVPTRDGRYVVAERVHERRNEIIAISTSDGSERTLTYGRRPFPSLDDQRVLFGSVDGPPRLLAIPIGGGAVTTIAELPGKLVLGADGPDGAEIQVKHDAALESWRVARDGHLEARHLVGNVFPAPSGGWRAVQTFDAGNHLRLVAPGVPLAAGTHEVTPESDRPTWLDDHRISYAAHGAFHVLDVTTGAEVATVPGPEWGQAAMLATDGVHWYDVQLVGHVTRHLLVNFGDRPWR